MELIFNLFIAALLLLFKESKTIEDITISTDRIGASGFPIMVIMISFILLIYITYDYLKNKKEKSKLLTKMLKD